jgi:hypothetical protein
MGENLRGGGRHSAPRFHGHTQSVVIAATWRISAAFAQVGDKIEKTYLCRGFFRRSGKWGTLL